MPIGLGDTTRVDLIIGSVPMLEQTEVPRQPQGMVAAQT